MAMNDEGDHFKERNEDLKELEKVCFQKTQQLKHLQALTMQWQQLHHLLLANFQHLEQEQCRGH